MIQRASSATRDVDLQTLREAREASHHSDRTNVGAMERAASTIAGGGLLYAGFKRGGMSGVLMGIVGGILAKRGVSGRCEIYSAMGVRSHGESFGSNPLSRFVDVEKAITIQRPVQEVYDFWRNFENLTCVAPHLCCVVGEGGRSHWEALTPRGMYQWDAQIIAEEPGRLIAWRTLEGSDFDHAGVVEFKPAPGGRGTEVRVYLRYHPPMGVIGAAASKMMQTSPGDEAASVLRQMKQLLESGEVATGAHHRGELRGGWSELAVDEEFVTEAVGGYGEAGAAMGVGGSISDREHQADDEVGEASEDSFPASDAPSWTTARS
jgi:uncharacterized membrane protein